MTAAPLLDPPLDSYRIVPGAPGVRLVLTCDHASNRIPPDYAGLGMPEGQLERHIAYDIGAETVTLELARRLGAPAVLGAFSRLLIDPNRGEDDPTLVMRLSDGAIVPGNARADRAEIERRLARFYRPYHAAIDATLDALQAEGAVPVVVAIHSFTPAWRGLQRPWHAAILWDSDPRLARPLIAALAADPAMTIGENEPYDGALKNDALYRHATSRGLPHALVELRQDLIASRAGAESWAARLAAAITPLLDGPELAHIRHYGSRADTSPAGAP